MNGALRIAGVERNVVIHGKVIRADNGELVLAGDREIDVRDFGVQPPRRFLGLLRVRREVTVHFLVAVRPLIDPLGILTASLQ
jgi:polyisoprenoid-binding protein YceI